MYRSIRPLSLATMILLGLNGAAVLLSIPSALMQLELAEDLDRGVYYDYAELDANDTREQTIGCGLSLLYFATAIVYWMWFHRAYQNLAAFGVERKHGLSWAVGAWIVPIISLFRPYQIAREIWYGSAPERAGLDELPGGHPPLLAWWWGSWILLNIAGQVSFRLAMNVDDPPSLIWSTYAAIASDIVNLLAVPLAVLVVRAITARQEDKNAAMQTGLGDAEVERLEEVFD